MVLGDKGFYTFRSELVFAKISSILNVLIKTTAIAYADQRIVINSQIFRTILGLKVKITFVELIFCSRILNQ